MIKPFAIITCLEDSPSFLDRGLINIYLHTAYTVEPAPGLTPGFSIRIGSSLPAMDHLFEKTGATTATYITAWNPYSAELPLAENRRRNRLLLLELHTVCTHLFEGVGNGSDSTWRPEESYLATGISLESALELAQKFEQNAIVWIEKGQKARLLWTNPPASKRY